MSNQLQILIVCILFVSKPTYSQDVDYFWNLNSGGNYQSSFSWVPFTANWMGPGGATDRVHFDLGVGTLDRYNVSNVSGINDQLIIENDTLTLELDGDYELTSEDDGFNSGVVIGRVPGDRGNVILKGAGTIQNNFTLIGFQDVSTGTVSLADPDLTWNVVDTTTVGWSGNGSISISNGAKYNTFFSDVGLNSDSTGLIHIEGNGSHYTNTSSMYVGRDGTGEILITDGGRLENPLSFTVIGLTELARGVVTVDGVGSHWQANSVIVSHTNNSFTPSDILNIFNGATCDCQSIRIGVHPSARGAVVVSGSESHLTVSEDLICGEQGRGVLNISNRGELSCQNAYVSKFDSNVACTVSMAGSGSAWNVDSLLSIGGDAMTGIPGGSGHVTIETGAALIVGGEVVLFPDSDLEVDGGTVIADRIRFENGGSFNFLSGSLSVDWFEGDLTNENGNLSPGGPIAGSTIIFGDYEQHETAQLCLDIGGVGTGSEHDFISADDVFIDGRIITNLYNDFIPDNNQTFTMLDAGSGSILGFFDNAGDGQRIDVAGGQGSFLIRYGVTSPNPGQIVLSDFQPADDVLYGDVNQDGEINLLDVAPFIDLLASGMYQPEADVNMDGEVNLLDVTPFIELLAG